MTLIISLHLKSEETIKATIINIVGRKVINEEIKAQKENGVEKHSYIPFSTPSQQSPQHSQHLLQDFEMQLQVELQQSRMALQQ